ncbi:hypothetical protein [Bacillus sp. T33-2]|nr:hypothetical protein [Bacillus sp. T33-2]PLR90851.1 bacitracin ABC transporter ATP-binding protein [Bacillus sp. T33-2]
MYKDKVPLLTDEFLDDLAKEITQPYGEPEREQTEGETKEL